MRIERPSRRNPGHDEWCGSNFARPADTTAINYGPCDCGADTGLHAPAQAEAAVSNAFEPELPKGWKHGEGLPEALRPAFAEAYQRLSIPTARGETLQELYVAILSREQQTLGEVVSLETKLARLEADIGALSRRLGWEQEQGRKTARALQETERDRDGLRAKVHHLRESEDKAIEEREKAIADLRYMRDVRAEIAEEREQLREEVKALREREERIVRLTRGYVEQFNAIGNVAG